MMVIMKVELNEDYVHDLRRERMKKHRRNLPSSSSSSCADFNLNNSLNSIGSSTTPSPMKSHGPPSSDSWMKDNRLASLRDYDDSASPSKSSGGMTRGRERGRERRMDSTDSTYSQVNLGLLLSDSVAYAICRPQSFRRDVYRGHRAGDQ